MAKVAVYCITKNEEQFIERWADSAAQADYRVVVDTGSTDDTVAIAQRAGCVVHQVTVSPWRFDDARNASLALLPSDADWCIALDADEVLVPGWRSYMDHIPAGVTRPRYRYTWSWNNDGTPGLVYTGDKIHTRFGYRWLHPVHEVLTPTGEQEVHGFIGLEIHHHPDDTKSRGQYLPLLEQAVKERPWDDRNAHYLAREYYYRGMYDKAIPEFIRHLELPTAKWGAERARSMRYLAEMQPDQRFSWLMKALSEDPHRRETWVDLAKYWYEQQRWPECYAACQHALSFTERTLDYLTEAEAWGYLPYDFAAISAYHMGMDDIARQLGQKAIELNPDDPRLHENQRFYDLARAEVPS